MGVGRFLKNDLRSDPTGNPKTQMGYACLPQSILKVSAYPISVLIRSLRLSAVFKNKSNQCNIKFPNKNQRKDSRR